MAPAYSCPGFQIQPGFENRERWQALAQRENLYYEVLELSSPPAVNDPDVFAVRREWYLACGRVRSVHGVFIDVNPGSGDEAFRNLSREKCAASCRLAKHLGAENVVFHSSCFPFLRDGYLDFWAGMCAEFYDELAQTWDINIFIENSPDVDPDPICELMNRTTDKRTGVCLDLGHVNYSRVGMEYWFDRLHERIGYLHLSDNNGFFDRHLPIGKGTVDWELADRLVSSLGRTVPATLETGTVEDTVCSLEYLRERELFAGLSSRKA